jgi:hypothetical protein
MAKDSGARSNVVSVIPCFLTRLDLHPDVGLFQDPDDQLLG